MNGCIHQFKSIFIRYIEGKGLDGNKRRTGSIFSHYALDTKWNVAAWVNGSLIRLTSYR